MSESDFVVGAPQTTSDSSGESSRYEVFEKWWRDVGRFYDPDSSDDWYDKRKGLAQFAFSAGIFAKQPRSAIEQGRPVPDAEKSAKP